MQPIDTAFARYVASAQRVPKLTKEDEQRLARRWLDRRDEAARDELVRAHLRYVVAIALKYRRYGVPVSELVSEGNFGLVHALDKFEPERGHRFVTYAAYWIRAYVLNYVIRSWSLVGVGSGVLRSKMFFKLRREKVRLMNLLGDEDSVRDALAKKLDLPPDRLANMLRRLETRDLSLDAKVFDDSGTTLVDTLASTHENQEEVVGGDEVRDHATSAVRRAVEALDRRERYIVEKRLMADREDALSLAEIGRKLGVSRERARQLEARAKRKLRLRITEMSRLEGGDWLDSAA